MYKDTAVKILDKSPLQDNCNLCQKIKTQIYEQNTKEKKFKDEMLDVNKFV